MRAAAAVEWKSLRDESSELSVRSDGVGSDAVCGRWWCALMCCVGGSVGVLEEACVACQKCKSINGGDRTLDLKRVKLAS